MPVLEHGDFSLYETQAILRYLDRQVPAPCLTPTDVREAARMDQIMGISDWYLFQRVSAVICFQRVIAPRLMGIAPDEAAIAKTLPFAHTTFGVLNRFLRDTPFLASGAVTLADLLVVPHIDMLSATPEWGILTRDQPDLVQWLDRMNARASLRNTTWDEVATLAKQSEEPLATAGPRGAEEQVTR